MRHVVLGSTTALGATIVRMLVSMSVEPIIAVSPSGEIPSGVNPNNVEVKFGDIIDSYSLLDVFEEGDIVYSTQSLLNETYSKQDSELFLNIGLINLLGIATAEKVKNIITVLPQTTGWKVPRNATEEAPQKRSISYHLYIKKAIEIIQKYWNGSEYGWDTKSIVNFIKGADIKQIGADKNERAKNKNGSENSVGPSLGPKIILNAGDNIGPSLEKNLTSSSTKNETSVEILGDKSGIAIKLDEEEVEEFERIPIILVRLAKFFGPYDNFLTEEFCRSVRLHRISLVGRMKRPITWINPIDAARALVILGSLESKINKEQFNVNGFIASPNDILKSLENINHSKTKIKRKLLLTEWVKHLLKLFLAAFGKNYNYEFYKYKSLNTRQIFSDLKSRTEWNWVAKYDLERTAKESMNWFIHHVL